MPSIGLDSGVLVTSRSVSPGLIGSEGILKPTPFELSVLKREGLVSMKQPTIMWMNSTILRNYILY